ncbi:MAG: ABC transporter permease [Defluviitaleaceae bacterium]|nr:ABC transporter permease [Defluviitaleaceae bacterium]
MRTISAENYKMRKSAQLKIMTVIGAAFALLMAFLLNYIQSMMAGVPEMGGQMGQAVDSLNYFSGLKAMFSITQLSQIITILTAVFAGTYIVNEFDKGTVRNALASGMSRTSWFFGKVYAMAAVTVWLVVVTDLVFILAGAAFAGWGAMDIGNIAGNFVLYFLMALLQSLAYSSIFLVIAFVIRGVGGTVGLGIAIYLVEQLAAQILPALNNNFLTKVANNLLYSINAAMRTWFMNYGSVFNADFAKLGITGIIVIVVTLAIAFITFQKRDVK